MKGTKIEWATHTFNPWIGCQKVSAACKYCYAETQVNRFGGHFSAVRRMTTDSYWKQPLKWNKEAEGATERPRVFCASLADVFENWHGTILDAKGRMICRNRFETDNWFSDREPIIDEHAITMDDVRARLFALIDSTPNLDWLLLTKRPENIAKMWCSHVNTDGLPPSQLHRSNVWLGTTVENQEQAAKRIPELLKCRDLSPVLFLSCEPLLGPVDLESLRIGSEFDKTGLPWFDCLDGTAFSCDDIGKGYPKIDWVIAGGESGRDARPMNPDWARSLRDQCQAAGVAYHFKQWGEWTYLPYRDNARLPLFKKADFHAFDEETVVYKVGKKAAGRMLDGREWNELPKGDN
jgi:protein gp37